LEPQRRDVRKGFRTSSWGIAVESATASPQDARSAATRYALEGARGMFGTSRAKPHPVRQEMPCMPKRSVQLGPFVPDAV